METNAGMGSQSATLDLSVLQPPIHMGVTGALQVLQCMTNGTQEMKHLLQEECHFIYECTVCGSLFRSVANLLSHKRIFCRLNHICEDFGLAYASAMEQAGLAMPPTTVTEVSVNQGDALPDSQPVNVDMAGEEAMESADLEAVDSDDSTIVSEQLDEPSDIIEKLDVLNTKDTEADKLAVEGNCATGEMDFLTEEEEEEDEDGEEGTEKAEALTQAQERMEESGLRLGHSENMAETGSYTLPSETANATEAEVSAEMNPTDTVAESFNNEVVKVPKTGKHGKQKHKDPEKKHKKRHSKKKSKKKKDTVDGISLAGLQHVPTPGKSKLKGREKMKGKWAYPCLYCSLTFAGSRMAIEHISIAHKHGQFINTTRLRDKIRRKSFFIPAGSSKEKFFHVKSTDEIVKRKKKKKKKKRQKGVKTETMEVVNNLVVDECGPEVVPPSQNEGQGEADGSPGHRVLGEVRYFGDTPSPALMEGDVKVKVERDTSSYCRCGAVDQDQLKQEIADQQGLEVVTGAAEATVYPCFYCQTVHSDIDVAFQHVREIHKDKRLNHNFIRRKLLEISAGQEPL